MKKQNPKTDQEDQEYQEVKEDLETILRGFRQIREG